MDSDEKNQQGPSRTTRSMARIGNSQDRMATYGPTQEHARARTGIAPRVEDGRNRYTPEQKHMSERDIRRNMNNEYENNKIHEEKQIEANRRRAQALIREFTVDQVGAPKTTNNSETNFSTNQLKQNESMNNEKNMSQSQPKIIDELSERVQTTIPNDRANFSREISNQRNRILQSPIGENTNTGMIPATENPSDLLEQSPLSRRTRFSPSNNSTKTNNTESAISRQSSPNSSMNSEVDAAWTMDDEEKAEFPGAARHANKHVTYHHSPALYTPNDNPNYNPYTTRTNATPNNAFTQNINSQSQSSEKSYNSPSRSTITSYNTRTNTMPMLRNSEHTNIMNKINTTITSHTTSSSQTSITTSPISLLHPSTVPATQSIPPGMGVLLAAAEEIGYERATIPIIKIDNNYKPYKMDTPKLHGGSTADACLAWDRSIILVLRTIAGFRLDFLAHPIEAFLKDSCPADQATITRIYQTVSIRFSEAISGNPEAQRMTRRFRANQIEHWWATINTNYVPNSNNDRAVRLQEFHHLHQADTENVRSFIGRVEEVADNIRLSGNAVSESDIMLVITAGLNDAQQQGFSAEGKQTMTYDQWRDYVIRLDDIPSTKRLRKTPTPTTTAFHTEIDEDNDEEAHAVDVRSIECRRCHQLGHYARDCHLPYIPSSQSAPTRTQVPRSDPYRPSTLPQRPVITRPQTTSPYNTQSSISNNYRAPAPTYPPQQYPRTPPPSTPHWFDPWGTPPTTQYGDYFTGYTPPYPHPIPYPHMQPPMYYHPQPYIPQYPYNGQPHQPNPTNTTPQTSTPTLTNPTSQNRTQQPNQTSVSHTATRIPTTQSNTQYPYPNRQPIPRPSSNNTTTPIRNDNIHPSRIPKIYGPGASTPRAATAEEQQTQDESGDSYQQQDDPEQEQEEPYTYLDMPEEGYHVSDPHLQPLFRLLFEAHTHWNPKDRGLLHDILRSILPILPTPTSTTSLTSTHPDDPNAHECYMTTLDDLSEQPPRQLTGTPPPIPSPEHLDPVATHAHAFVLTYVIDALHHLRTHVSHLTHHIPTTSTHDTNVIMYETQYVTTFINTIIDLINPHITTAIARTEPPETEMPPQNDGNNSDSDYTPTHADTKRLKTRPPTEYIKDDHSRPEPTTRPNTDPPPMKRHSPRLALQHTRREHPPIAESKNVYDDYSVNVDNLIHEMLCHVTNTPTSTGPLRQPQRSAKDIAYDLETYTDSCNNQPTSTDTAEPKTGASPTTAPSSHSQATSKQTNPHSQKEEHSAREPQTTPSRKRKHLSEHPLNSYKDPTLPLSTRSNSHNYRPHTNPQRLQRTNRMTTHNRATPRREQITTLITQPTNHTALDTNNSSNIISTAPTALTTTTTNVTNQLILNGLLSILMNPLTCHLDFTFPLISRQYAYIETHVRRARLYVFATLHSLNNRINSIYTSTTTTITVDSALQTQPSEIWSLPELHTLLYMRHFQSLTTIYPNQTAAGQTYRTPVDEVMPILTGTYYSSRQASRIVDNQNPVSTAATSSASNPTTNVIRRTSARILQQYNTNLPTTTPNSMTDLTEQGNTNTVTPAHTPHTNVSYLLPTSQIRISLFHTHIDPHLTHMKINASVHLQSTSTTLLQILYSTMNTLLAIPFTQSSRHYTRQINRITTTVINRIHSLFISTLLETFPFSTSYTHITTYTFSLAHIFQRTLRAPSLHDNNTIHSNTYQDRITENEITQTMNTIDTENDNNPIIYRIAPPQHTQTTIFSPILPRLRSTLTTHIHRHHALRIDSIRHHEELVTSFIHTVTEILDEFLQYHQPHPLIRTPYSYALALSLLHFLPNTMFSALTHTDIEHVINHSLTRVPTHTAPTFIYTPARMLLTLNTLLTLHISHIHYLIHLYRDYNFHRPIHHFDYNIDPVLRQSLLTTILTIFQNLIQETCAREIPEEHNNTLTTLSSHLTNTITRYYFSSSHISPRILSPEPDTIINHLLRIHASIAHIDLRPILLPSHLPAITSPDSMLNDSIFTTTSLNHSPPSTPTSSNTLTTATTDKLTSAALASTDNDEDIDTSETELDDTSSDTSEPPGTDDDSNNPDDNNGQPPPPPPPSSGNTTNHRQSNSTLHQDNSTTNRDNNDTTNTDESNTNDNGHNNMTDHSAYITIDNNDTYSSSTNTDPESDCLNNTAYVSSIINRYGLIPDHTVTSPPTSRYPSTSAYRRLAQSITTIPRGPLLSVLVQTTDQPTAYTRTTDFQTL